MTYTNIKVIIYEGQIQKIKSAAELGQPISIKLSHSDLTGEHIIAVTQGQLKKLTIAYENNKAITLEFSKAQLKYNATISGGFISAILPFLASAGKFLLGSVVPNLMSGLINGAGSATGQTVINKIVGNGVVFLKQQGKICKLGSYKASGLYLRPFHGESMNALNDGLYVRSGSGLYRTSGAGLITGDSQISRTLSQISLIGSLLSAII